MDAVKAEINFLRRGVNMNVGDIIKDYLISIGADGLCNPDLECGCSINELFLCDSCFDQCETAKKTICEDEKDEWYGEEIFVPFDGEDEDNVCTKCFKPFDNKLPKGLCPICIAKNGEDGE